MPLSQQTRYTVRIGSHFVPAPVESSEPAFVIDPVVIEEILQEDEDIDDGDGGTYSPCDCAWQVGRS